MRWSRPLGAVRKRIEYMAISRHPIFIIWESRRKGSTICLIRGPDRDQFESPNMTIENAVLACIIEYYWNTETRFYNRRKHFRPRKFVKIRFWNPSYSCVFNKSNTKKQKTWKKWKFHVFFISNRPIQRQEANYSKMRKSVLRLVSDGSAVKKVWNKRIFRISELDL